MSSDITTEVEENQIADNPTDILPKLPTEPQSEPTTNSNNDELPNRSKVTSVQAIGKNLLQQRKTSKDSDDDEIVLIRSNPETKIRQINKSAYAKLQRSLAENRSVKLIDDLKGVYENKSSTDDSQVEKPDVVQVRIKRSSTIKADGEAAQSIKSRYTPSSFGYTSQTSHSKLPVPRPRSLQTQSKPDVPFKTISHFSLPPTQKKDENSNLISNKSIAESSEFISVVTRSESEHSIDKINAELNQFTMERKPREKKRSGSFRKIFNGSLFGRDKKKKEEEKNKYQNVVNMYSDNVQNDGNTFNRQSPFRHTVDGGVKTNNEVKVTRSVTTSNCKASDLEKKYADLHINNFNHARKNFEIPTEDYVDMSNNSNQTSKGRIYLNAPSISKYIDTSSSASTAGSEKLNTYDKTNNGGVHELARYSNIPLPTRNTPPRAQETRQDVKLVNPKALIPINSERPLPNPYQNEGDSKNMESKGGEESTNNVHLDETYGTVADSVEYRRRPHSNKEEDKAPSRSPSFESTKLKLPPNRDIYRLEPRVKSPIPQANVSAEKIIATELLKSSRSPTPPRRNIKQTQQRDHVDYPRETQNRNYENYNTITEPVVSSKPPRGNSVQRTNEPIYSSEKFTTSAMVHSPTLKSPTPTNVLNRSLSPVTIRSTTPNDLRSSSSLKLSPQKEDIRRNVEAYYWNEIKKLQEQEYADYYYHMQYSRDPVQIRKSRSSSPHVNRSRRALSLPRDVRPENYQLVQGASGNSYIIQPNAIPEGRAVINQVNSRNSFSVPGNYQQAFIRNTLERSTIEGSPRRMVDNGSLSRPIFKRGSLTKQAAEEEEQQINKKVSFSNLNRAENQQWPTRNGYTQSPPQRRIDKVESPLEDDVFIQQGPVYDYAVRRQNAPRQVPAHYYSDSEEIYFKMPPRNNPQNVANNQMARFLQAKRQQQEQDLYCQPRDFIPNPVYGLTRHGSISSQEGFYGHRVPPGIRRRPSYDSGSFPRQNFQEPHYANRPLVPPPIEPPRRRELILAGDESFSQPLNQTVPIAAANQRNSQYSSRQALAEAIYSRTGPRQISIRNKVCDIYGQIHEGESPYGQVQRSGVIMGQLQQSPSGVIVRQPVNGQFVRGTRLTASANDMYRNYQNVEARYRSGPVYVQNDAPSKPLPPLPNKSKKIFRHVSDTDSVSDASEIQRITNSSAKTKKRSFFGKSRQK